MKRVTIGYGMLLLVSAFGLGIVFSGCEKNSENSSESSTTPDTIAPTVSFTDPDDLATRVAVNGTIAATFSEAMDPATITTATFVLRKGTTPVPCAVECVGTVATLYPTRNLAVNTTYTATITTGANDLEGNALAVAKTWRFTTGTRIAKGPGAVNLGTARNFAILSKAGISATGTTRIDGDIGVSPAAATYITGFGLVRDASGIFSTSLRSEIAFGLPKDMEKTCRFLRKRPARSSALVTWW
jgi:hypothetical protein